MAHTALREGAPGMRGRFEHDPGAAAALCGPAEAAPTLPAPMRRARTDASRRRSVEQAIVAMRERLGEPLSLHTIARAGASSRYHFDRIFREVTGLSPFRFLAALRLEAAKRLLLTTAHSATSICFEVGYNSVGSFTRHFSEAVGIAPQRLRRFAASDVVPRASGAPAEAAPTALACIEGRVDAPEGFTGVVFVGVFVGPLPSGRPAACVLLGGPGPFRAGPVPGGAYHVFAAGVAPDAVGAVDLLDEGVLRGSAGPVEVGAGGARGPTGVVLRPGEPVDPPILVCLPLLLAEQLTASRARRP